MEKMINDGSILISPSILSGDFAKIKESVDSIKNSDMIHCDVMDGIFVPNISFGAKMVADIRNVTSAFLDVHLMIVKPADYIAQFVKAGANLITFHIESQSDTLSTLRLIKDSGIRCGIAISPDTPIEALIPYLPQCDLVLLMSVYPGFSGQKFIPKSIERLNQLRQLKQRLNPNLLIEIDGGITLENIKEVFDSGVQVAVAGNTVFKAQNPSMMIDKLKEMTRA